MCHECWKEFKGWCKSFTITETFLSILEGALLVLCIAFVIFLLLHFVACSARSRDDDVVTTVRPNVTDGTTSSGDTTTGSTKELSTFGPDVECTWKPSQKTRAATRYFERKLSSKTTPVPDARHPGGAADGAPAQEPYAGAVLALQRRGDFACAAAALAPRWALTAASCLEAAEEVASLDSFVLVERRGARGERAHALAAVLLHPHAARGRAPRTDLAALRTARALAAAPLALPALVDHFKVTLGERLLLLGFGPYRSGGGDRRLRQAAVFVSAGCEAEAGAEAGAGAGWSARHLSRGAAVSHAACGLRAVCAGPLRREGACQYCGGSPLVRARRLLGVMSQHAACGASCAPTLFASVAAAADWLRFVLAQD